MWPISVFLPFADFRRLFQRITISIIDNISKTFEGGDKGFNFFSFRISLMERIYHNIIFINKSNFLYACIIMTNILYNASY